MIRQAATWIAPVDAIDRGNVLGAAVVVAQRDGRELVTIVEGARETKAAIRAGRETGVLIVPALEQVTPDAADTRKLLRRARKQRWRLLLLTMGADSASESGRAAERLLSRLARIRLPKDRSPVPPPDLRHRVGGGSESTFFRHGLVHVEDFESCLADAGVRLAECRDLLDWGAGCGRMTVHLLSRACGARITAVDTDGEAMAWVAEHLPVTAKTIPILPPTELASDGFDLVIGHSVFSHLPLGAQDQWLQELTRITRRGGHVAVSVNGPTALSWHLEHPLVDVPESIAETVASKGIATWAGDGWETEFYEGYHTTFHSHDYIRRHWSRWFEVVEIYEAAALPTQDIVVLRA